MDKDIKKAPVAFFAYRRPLHALKSLESLSLCEGAGESELFIYCDGAKGEKDGKDVEETRRAVKSKKWCGRVHVIERDKNMGLADSIISGVTELVERHGRVIVLEDDLVLSPQFLNYMNGALEFYDGVPKVMHISGYMFPVKGEIPETFFYRSASCWGWATWKRAWDKLEPDPKKLLSRFTDKVMVREFNVRGAMNSYQTLKENAEGKIRTWAARWYASVFLAGGLCLHPGSSLVNNIGHDGTGVHCGKTDAFDVELAQKRITDFTTDYKENERVLGLILEFFSAVNKRSPKEILFDGLKRIKGALIQ